MPDFASIIGRVGGPSPSVAVPQFDINSGLEPIRRAQQDAAEALAALDGIYEGRKTELRKHYQLSETDEERARIQQLLDMIEVQRSEGTQVIERVYGDAIQGAAVRAEQTRAAGVQAGQQTAQTFTSGAADLAGTFSALNEDFGGAMGVAGEALSPVAQAAIADMHRQGAIESAFDRRMFNLTADDISVLGEAMRPEMGAQIGALQRDAMRVSTLGQVEHNRQVQDRITNERLSYQQALQDLAAQFDNRRFGLKDTQISLGLQEGDMLGANARHLSTLQAQSQQEAARIAAAERAQRQDLAMRQAQMEYERQLAEFEAKRQEQALRGMGADARQAGFATALGLEQDLGASLLFPDPQQQLIEQMMASGRIQ